MRYITKATEPDEFIKWKEQEHENLERWYKDKDKKVEEIWAYLKSTNPPINRRIKGAIYYSKAELRNTLIDEQGGICCYCGQKIEKDSTTKLEHLEAKSLDKRTTFQYDNIYASCEGGNTTEYTVKHDGERIGDIAETVRVDINTLMDLNPDTIFQLLEKGDKIIHQRLDKHCDAEKNNKPIFVKPNELDCEEKFIYEPSGEIKAISEDVEDKVINTINQLGLNNNKKLKAIRAAAWERAIVRIETLQKIAGNDIDVFKELMNKMYKKLSHIDENDSLYECCFVERFVLKKIGNL
jgi:uncharacterized protein (TIGR02646 family)